MTAKERLVECGLDQISVGIGIFDAEQRLVFCNRQFQTLRSYPDDLCAPGASLEDMLRFNAERGDFGPGDVEPQIADRLREIHQSDERKIEREMPDGQILSIRYQHLEGGGLTVSFEDKTDEHRAQTALHLSEERYALISEAAEEAIYEWDIVNDRFFASPRLNKFLGRETNASGERRWRWEERVHADDRALYDKSLAAHLSGKLERWQCEYRFRNVADEYRWISDHGTSIRDDEGQAVRMVAAIQDITERIEREAALAASEERHQLITEASSDGIYDWNVVADTLYVSDKLKEMFGFGPELLQSQMWADGVHPDDLDRYLAAVLNHFKGKADNIECEYRIAGSDGVYRWVRDHGIGVRGADGKVVRLVGAVRDITSGRAAEEELDRAKTRLLDSLETISDGFLLVDSQDRVQLLNRRYLEIFSSAAGSDIADTVTTGRPFLDMIREDYERGMFKPHPGGVDDWIADRLEARSTPSAELEMELSNGRWLLVNERQMSDGGRVSIYSDITEFKKREEDLEAARARFEDAIAALSSGFALFDSDDRLVVCNTKYQAYFRELADVVIPGTPFVEIIQVAYERGMFPEAVGNRDEWLANLLKRRAAASGTREQHLEDGLWLQVSDHRTKDGGIVSIYTNVTELKNREEDLRKQSALLEATMENMDQGISMVDSDLNVVAFNHKFLEYLQFPEDRFQLGFPMEQAFRFNAERGEYGDGNVEEQVSQRLELAARFEAHRLQRTRKDGVVLEIAGNPVDGGGFVTTYSDITERKRSEDALKNREGELSAALQELNAVLDTIEYGVLFMGPDLKARVINRAFGKMWGISQDFIDASPTMRELLEYNKETGIYDVSPQDWDGWVESRVKAVRQGAVAPTELHRADGKILQFQAIALQDGGRMMTYFDITELKQREAELISARDAAQKTLHDLELTQERLVQSEKMASLGHLTAGIAHEIKNPLNFVNNFAKLSVELLEELEEILKEPIACLDDEGRRDAQDLFSTASENLTKISQHGGRADSIVKNMLMHSREGPSLSRLSGVNDLAEEALNLAYHGARAENPEFNIEIIKNLAPDAGKIECFPQDLMRVFLNLITNGMYAAHKRSLESDETGGTTTPTITLNTINRDDHVEVEVLDNGSGIPHNIREKLFLPFFTTKPAGEGTGLGLSLSYDIVVKQHGGDITVESEPGSCTAFTVKLPRSLPTGAAISG